MARVSAFRSTVAYSAFCRLYDAPVAASPIPIAESDVEISWGSTHILAAGIPSNPPLVARDVLVATVTDAPGQPPGRDD